MESRAEHFSEWLEEEIERSRQFNYDMAGKLKMNPERVRNLLEQAGDDPGALNITLALLTDAELGEYVSNLPTTEDPQSSG